MLSRRDILKAVAGAGLALGAPLRKLWAGRLDGTPRAPCDLWAGLVRCRGSRGRWFTRREEEGFPGTPFQSERVLIERDWKIAFETSNRDVWLELIPAFGAINTRLYAGVPPFCLQMTQITGEERGVVLEGTIQLIERCPPESWQRFVIDAKGTVCKMRVYSEVDFSEWLPPVEKWEDAPDG